MCIDCFDDEDLNDPIGVTEELVQLARQIEEDLSGEPVADGAWCVFFGRQSGSLVWREHERMARSWEAAQAAMAAVRGAAGVEERL
jgi:hypothetical protein